MYIEHTKSACERCLEQRRDNALENLGVGHGRWITVDDHKCRAYCIVVIDNRFLVVEVDPRLPDNLIADRLGPSPKINTGSLTEWWPQGGSVRLVAFFFRR